MSCVTVGMGTCGMAAGSGAVLDAARDWVARHAPHVEIVTTGCLGMCYREVVVGLPLTGGGQQLYGGVTADRVGDLLEAHFLRRAVVPDLLIQPEGPDASFLRLEDRIALRLCGRVDPESLEAYRAHGGYAALTQALREMTPAQVIDRVIEAGLRGRGGAGYPTGRKWAAARAAAGDDKVVVCNGDEGDPGAFMDRGLLEGDPFAVLEGLTLAAYAIGARRGIVYVRAEYPLAVERVSAAIVQARAAGLLGPKVFGPAAEHGFDVVVRRGAGAFVCGEETALIAALEGRRGMPRPRPPYPVESGLHGQPTCINNVETLANLPWIVTHGAGAYRARGTASSPGTKVFSLAGDVRRGGLVEVPMGTTIRELVEEIGGGTPSGLPIKAVQLGGPSGGCLPAALFDTPIDYDALRDTGAIMGSGGIVVLDESRCMVDVARYFLTFTQRESCGRCTFCRIGTKRLLEALERLTSGKGRRADLARLEELAPQVGEASLCGLGRTAPNPVLTTIRWFRDEYEAHVQGRCKALYCRPLVHLKVDPWLCDGCTMCFDQCPAAAIARVGSGVAMGIDPEVCARCGGCRDVCRFSAISVAEGHS